MHKYNLLFSNNAIGVYSSPQPISRKDIIEFDDKYWHVNNVIHYKEGNPSLRIFEYDIEKFLVKEPEWMKDVDWVGRTAVSISIPRYDYGNDYKSETFVGYDVGSGYITKDRVVHLNTRSVEVRTESGTRYHHKMRIHDNHEAAIAYSEKELRTNKYQVRNPEDR